MYYKIIFLLFILGCGPTFLKKSENSVSIKKIVVLPINIEADVSKEDSNFLESLIISRLKEKGYTVLDPTLVGRFCRNKNSCESNLIKMNDSFSPDAYVKINISSSFALNILAGHYNTLGGELVFLSKDEIPIYSVTHDESERGGLIFNSGQVLQGLIESYDEYGTSPFKRLSQKFTESVISVLPRATLIVGTSSLRKPTFDYLISKTKIPDQSKICVGSNQRGRAQITFHNLEVNLRENNFELDNKRSFPELENLYCSILPLEEVLKLNGDNSIELKFTSFYGETNYKDITDSIKKLK